MSKRGYISRYMLIVKKLKAKPYSTYEELQSYLDNRFEYMQMQDDDLNVGFSKRTFQRDIREIKNVFGVDIEYSKRYKGYFITQSEKDSDRSNMNFQRMIEAFDVFNSLSLAQDMTPYIHFEKKRLQGTENLYGLIHAIKNRFTIKFQYQKFWEGMQKARSVYPYALKEFKNRWYIIGKNNNNIRCFALDRLSDLEITNEKFEIPLTFNIDEFFQYCFGIITPDNNNPQEIILSFHPEQGKYIKSLPLHETQEILIDDEDELRIKLKLHDTFDFQMELLTFGDSLKVISPKSLVKSISSAHKKAFELY